MAAVKGGERYKLGDGDSDADKSRQLQHRADAGMSHLAGDLDNADRPGGVKGTAPINISMIPFLYKIRESQTEDAPSGIARQKGRLSLAITTLVVLEAIPIAPSPSGGFQRGTRWTVSREASACCNSDRNFRAKIQLNFTR